MERYLKRMSKPGQDQHTAPGLVTASPTSALHTIGEMPEVSSVLHRRVRSNVSHRCNHILQCSRGEATLS
jgi:hypothetical protein